jgi:hypothetical protein
MRSYQGVATFFADWTVEQAVKIFTTKLPNADDDPRNSLASTDTSVLEDIEYYMAEAAAARHGGGPNVQPSSIVYTVLGILVAIWLLILDRKLIDHGSVTDVLLHQISPNARTLVGMTANLSGTRAEIDLTGRAPEATDEEARLGRKARNAEADRVAKLTRQIFDSFDPSPFFKDDTLTAQERARAKASQADRSKTGTPSRKERAAGARVAGQIRRLGGKMTNALREAILADDSHPDRRVPDHIAKRNSERLEALMNKVVAAAAPQGLPDGYKHDIAVDETLALVLTGRAGHGTASDKLIAADPDAYYWKGKSEDDLERGLGYGIEVLWRAGRPYERRIPMIPVAVSIGEPRGGDMSRVSRVHALAVRFGVISPDPQDRGYFIADMGYSPSDDYLPFVLQQGYKPVFQMPNNWKYDEVLSDTGAQGQPVNGARLHSGGICCPAGEGIAPLQPLPFKYEEKDEEIIQRAKTAESISLHLMPTRVPLRPHGRKEKAKLAADETPARYALTVQCPHAAGKVECPIKRRLVGGRRNAELPELDTRHMPEEDDALPTVCRQDYTTVHLTLQQAKKVQPLVHGSHLWHDTFNTVRSANERGNNSLTNRNSIGASGKWTEQRGIVKQGIYWAIAASQASLRLQQDFRTKHIGADGLPTFQRREATRRRRQELLRPRRTRRRGSRAKANSD